MGMRTLKLDESGSTRWTNISHPSFLVLHHQLSIQLHHLNIDDIQDIENQAAMTNEHHVRGIASATM
jgi:hypothetical protein